jgi:hypothetical protein
VAFGWGKFLGFVEYIYSREYDGLILTLFSWEKGK